MVGVGGSGGGPLSPLLLILEDEVSKVKELEDDDDGVERFGK